MRFAQTLRIGAASVICAGSLAACGNSKMSTPTTTPTPSPSAPPSTPASPPSGLTNGNLAAVQQCLKAAGITLPSAPTGAGGSFPAGVSPPPGGSLPAGGFPSGAVPSGGPGAFANPQTQQALKACGITLPSAAPTS
jgi:hypothetical protein